MLTDFLFSTYWGLHWYVYCFVFVCEDKDLTYNKSIQSMSTLTWVFQYNYIVLNVLLCLYSCCRFGIVIYVFMIFIWQANNRLQFDSCFGFFAEVFLCLDLLLSISVWREELAYRHLHMSENCYGWTMCMCVCVCVCDGLADQTHICLWDRVESVLSPQTSQY